MRVLFSLFFLFFSFCFGLFVVRREREKKKQASDGDVERVSENMEKTNGKFDFFIYN